MPVTYFGSSRGKPVPQQEWAEVRHNGERREHFGVPRFCGPCKGGVHTHSGPVGCTELVGKEPRDWPCKCMVNRPVFPRIV